MLDRTQVDKRVRAALIEAIPLLRSVALRLSRNVDRADDLVQETLAHAWADIHAFDGTNMKAWTKTILRNIFFSEQRTRKNEVEDVDDTHSQHWMRCPSQEKHLFMWDLCRALEKIAKNGTGNSSECVRKHYFKAVMLQAEGYSTEEIAALEGDQVRSVRDRLTKGRELIAKYFGADNAELLRGDVSWRACGDLGRDVFAGRKYKKALETVGTQ